MWWREYGARVMKARVALAVATVAAVAAVMAAPAEALVYWGGTDGDPAVPSIGLATLDGTAFTAAFISDVGRAGPVAVNRTHVFWLNGSTVGRANLDGSDANPRFVSLGSDARGLAVSESHIYWANFAGNSIGRANVNGSGVNASFITGASQPLGVAVDGSHIYWSNNDASCESSAIGRANLDGSGANQSFIASVNCSTSVAVSGSHVYWAIQGGPSGRLARANVDGSGANLSLVPDIGFNGTGVAASPSHVYWVDEGSIGRANLDGTGANRRFIARGAFFSPWGLAVDALTRPPGPPPPAVGRTVNAAVVSGVVTVRRRGTRVFRRLGGAAQIPVGSEVDTRRGQVRLTSAAGPGGATQTANLYDGRFVIRQARARLPVTELALSEPLTCRRGAGARAAARSRRLWGKGRGRFRTRGRRAAGTVRGTTWLTQDTCTSTTIRVREGVVAVRDFVRRRTVTVRAGRSYTARARR